MRRHRGARLRTIGLAALAFLPLLLPGEASGYGFLFVPGSQGVPRRWDLAALPDGRVPWQLATVVGPNVVGDRSPLDVVTQAFASWEGVDASGIRFVFAGTTVARERNARDRVNLVTLGSQESLGTGVLAAAFLSSDGSGALTDVDIVFGNNVAFSTSVAADPVRYDLQSVATHEIGHLLGLEHTGLSRATMAPFTDRGDVHQRTPDSDDRIGAGLLYPDGGFLGTTGSVAGRVTLAGAEVYLSHVVATSVSGRAVASAFTAPDGSYLIQGLIPDVYLVYAEPLDGPVTPANVGGFRSAFGGDPTVGYGTFFH